MYQLQQRNHVWVDTAYTDGRELYYVDIGLGFLTWNSYNLILQFCREQGEIIICGDPSTLVQQQWSGWTKVFLNKFCPRKDWVQRHANFILHLQADMIVAHHNHMWFKFKL